VVVNVVGGKVLLKYAMAWVVQGDGMRGTYSIAALAEIEQLGYTQRFGSVYKPAS